MKQYQVTTQWAGWWGGYGADHTLTSYLNSMAQEGWRLLSTKVSWNMWYWPLPLFRKKLLYVWERSDRAEPSQTDPPTRQFGEH